MSLFSTLPPEWNAKTVSITLYWMCGHVTHHDDWEPRYCPVCCGLPTQLLLTHEKRIEQ